MNWKARALSTKALDDNHLSAIISRGKPLSHAEAVALIGMVIRERGDKVEGVILALPQSSEPDKDEKKPSKRSEPEKIPVDQLVSSEDNKTPWTELVEQAKKDDRLAMAIEEGVITPVKRPG